jgi:hypothetical protein
VVDALDGIENTISGPATVFTVDPVVTALGFHPAGSGFRCQRHLQGEPASAPVVLTTAPIPFACGSPRTRTSLKP